jgi:hypothetical protein
MLNKIFGKKKSDELEKIHGVDIEKGVIYIGDLDERGTTSTEEVLADVGNSADITPISGGGAKVFVLDLKPFFKVIGTERGERAADTLIRFCDNWLSRSVGKQGAYIYPGEDAFYFRLGLPNDEATRAAVKIVNDIGLQYLRDSFKPQMVEEVLATVDEAEVMDSKGRLDPVKAEKIRLSGRTVKMKEDWTVASSFTQAKPEVTAEWAVVQEARAKVPRGPDRRVKKRPIAGPERRRRKHGRRSKDQPNSW